jgi:hypothetical protein
MEEYIKWLENKIEVCLEDKDLQREHWAFCQALKKYHELALHQPPVMVRSEQLPTPQDIQWKATQLTNTAFNEWWEKQVGNTLLADAVLHKN